MSDVDYYKLSVDQRVKLSIAFSSEKSTGTGWNYELLAEDGSVLGASDCNRVLVLAARSFPRVFKPARII